MPQTALVKHTRRRHKAVRTGCYTCKIRRVKCDEAQPACAKCTSTGRKCDGYPPKAESRLSVPAGLNPSLFADAIDAMTFDFFRRRTVPQLFGYFDTSSFWGHRTLQISYNEPAVRYAANALSELHRNFEDSLGQRGQWDRVRQQSTLTHYAAALSHMKHILQSPNSSLDVLLVACLLLASVETFQGRYEAADVHLRCALRISATINNTDTQEKSPSLHHTQEVLKHPILCALVRLRVQCGLFLNLGSAIPKALTDIGPYLPVEIPDHFTSLSEARDTLFTQIGNFFRITNQVALTKTSTSEATGDLEDRIKHYMAEVNHDPVITQLQYVRVMGLERWKRAYEEFMSVYSRQLSPADVRASRFLDLYRDTLDIILHIDYTKGIMAADDFEDEFDMLLGKLRQFINDSNAAQAQSMFTFEMGIIPLLYFLATDCRNYTTRHAAYALLAASRSREGTWDASAVCKAAEKLIAFEEANRVRGVLGAEGIAQDHRVLEMEAQLDLVRRRAVVVFYHFHGSKTEVITW
ncbi:hypothetical protein BDV25DRAFT_135759 [Aspergillus avenaceus]|uniref:Zn(2)-C6 fungal-type domain-containing protein n=1 Tax=Aspergillus avenaceus TaxID=36643 RepID=A0A5N6U7Q5_ASPAV|nr:hypothetical protein BDV25DRAFT_135759 [Aspergillus avenaceus]